MKEQKKYAISVIAGLLTIIVSSIILFSSGSYAVYTADTAKRKLPVYGVGRDDGALSISFDCAWGTDYTDKILDTLDFYNVKATFFVVQFWAEKYPDYLKKIVGRGHEVGTHSKTHPKMSKLSAEEIEEELKSSVAAIENVTGQKVKLFRPPFGDYDDGSGSIILMHNNGLHTAESLPLIFTATQQKGLVYRPISELIYTDDFRITPDGTQIKN